MNLNDKIFLAGHNGLVGSAILLQLQNQGFKNLLTKSRNELDLKNQSDVLDFFMHERPDFVILAAAKVGGINANSNFPADFIYDNLMIQSNVINSSYKCNVKKLLFLGSSCIYPKLAIQPMKESSLLTGPLEPTNEPYAIAKIAGIKLCESYNRQFNTDFRSVMPTNLYGPNDNFHPENSHVIPGLIFRFHEALINNLPEVTIWGDGRAKREFLYVDDMAKASLFILGLDQKTYKSNTLETLSHINIGTGKDLSIYELAKTLKEVIGFKGVIKFDKSKPNGPPRKLVDSSSLQKLGWKYNVELLEGLSKTYSWYVDNL
jgi:GDP-L-fucose synthase